MPTYTLNAKNRTEIGKKAQKVRDESLIPAVVYGKKAENRVVSVVKSDFDKVYAQAGASNLVALILEDGAQVPVLIHEIQRDPRLNTVQHIDFYQVNMKEKLTAHVPLKFIGESKAVKGLGGILVKNFNQIEVECLPKDLVSEIIVDISKLASFEDSITVADLEIPTGLEVKVNLRSIVAIVTPPISEDELKKSLEGKPEANIEDIKVEEKGKKEEKEEAK